MKQLRSALFALVAVTGIAHAQQEEERRAPPVEIPDFSNLDEYVYEPKSILTIGIRHVSGAKTKFSGQGRINSPEDPGAATGANLTRVYHDGAVRPDARLTSRIDGSGNPLLDQGGSGLFDPGAQDGRTNTWNLSDDRQLVIPGYVAFHSYSAAVTDTSVRSQAGNSTAGLDIASSRDMGKLFNTRMTWNLTAGMSLNDISSNTSGKVQATLSTLTDYYSLYGVTPPAAPYSAPSTSSTPILDASGNPLIDDSGVSQTVSTDTTVLLGNEPAGRATTTSTDSTSVTNHWKVKGAFYTFRAGPTVFFPISQRFRASVSLGAALVYAGTSYTVTQAFTPEIGSEITDTTTNATYKLLPGFFADASVQFDITERSGIYAGAVFQSAGSYTQNLTTATSNYATKVDLSNQNGLRAGMTIRF